MKRIPQSPTLTALALTLLIPLVVHAVSHAGQTPAAAPTHGTAQAAKAATPDAKAPMTASSHSMTASKPAAHASKAPKRPALDLNAASKEQLMTLHGVTSEVAEKIIAARPFKSREELLSKNLVSREAYRKLRYMVTAKAVSSTSSNPEHASGTTEVKSTGDSK